MFAALDGVVLETAHWSGPDADVSRTRYAAEVRPSAESTASSLDSRSVLLNTEADQQDAASAPDGTAAGGAAASDVAAGMIGTPWVPTGLAGIGPASSAMLGLWDHRGDERSGRRGDGRENTPRNGGDDSYVPNADNPNAQYATAGPPATPQGETSLGKGVPGTSADAPEAPAWTPPADGAGEYNSEFAGPVDHATHSLAREGADLKRGDWPNASEHLDHFLDNTGEDYDAGVDSLIAVQPEFAQAVEESRHQAGQDAVARARADGASGPVTYPLSTPWEGHTADGDWFYASGSFNYNQTGTVTAYPPDADHSEWRYEVDTQVNFRDRYNWDGGKATEIGPFTVTDEKLAALHRAGIAREYNLLGESSAQHTEGTVS